MKNCRTHAFKDTAQIFTMALPDQEGIAHFRSSEGNSTEVSSSPVEIILPTCLEPRLTKESHIDGARERFEEVESHSPKYHRRVRIGNADKLPTNDDDSDYAKCTLYTVLKGLFTNYRKRILN